MRNEEEEEEEEKDEEEERCRWEDVDDAAASAAAATGDEKKGMGETGEESRISSPINTRAASGKDAVAYGGEVSCEREKERERETRVRIVLRRFRDVLSLSRMYASSCNIDAR